MAADHIWKTSCALHNWLLEVDGLSSQWKKGIPSDWEGDLGLHNLKDVHHRASIPAAILELQSEDMLRNYDASRISFQGMNYFDSSYENEELQDTEENENDESTNKIISLPQQRAIDVTKLSQKLFVKKLVKERN